MLRGKQVEISPRHLHTLFELLLIKITFIQIEALFRNLCLLLVTAELKEIPIDIRPIQRPECGIPALRRQHRPGRRDRRRLIADRRTIAGIGCAVYLFRSQVQIGEIFILDFPDIRTGRLDIVGLRPDRTIIIEGSLNSLPERKRLRHRLAGWPTKQQRPGQNPKKLF